MLPDSVSPHQPGPNRRLLLRFARIGMICLALAAASSGGRNGSILIASARAQSSEQTPVDKAREAVETLINRLRGIDMPEGNVKTNGRIEATQVDVSAKYPGRLATLNVDEGDEVTAGQVVGTISSPETEAQLRSAQAQVLKAKQALSEAIAMIAQEGQQFLERFWRSIFTNICANM